MSRKGNPDGGSPAVSEPPVSPASSSSASSSGSKSIASPSLLSDLLRAFRRRWLMASTLGLLLGGAVGALVWLLLPPSYSAEARLRLVVPGFDPSGNEESEIGRLQRAQIELIQSSAVLEAVVHRPEIARLPSLQGQGDPLAWLGSHVTVEAGPTLDRIQVRVVSGHPDEAERLVQAIVEVYVQQSAAQRRAALVQLKDARQRASVSLDHQRQRLAQLENSRLNAAEKEGVQARIDLRVARAEVAAQEQRPAGADPVVVPPGEVDVRMREDAEAQRWNAEAGAIEEQIRQVVRISALKERDPSLTSLLRQRDEAHKRFDRRREEVRQLVEQQGRRRSIEEHHEQLARLRARVTTYEGLVASLAEEVKKLGGAAAAEEQKTLREQIAAESETLRKLSAEIERAERAAAPADAGAMETVTVQPWNMARRVQLAGLGGASSCLLVVLAVSGRELRLRRITAGSDLVRRLDLPIVGSIPRAAGRPAATLADLDGEGQVNEAVDALRTVLLREGESGPRLLLVTSAVEGEGKTSLAVRLAASLARGWRKTLFIDADLRKPAAHLLFETPLEPGLSELLRGEAEVADVIQPAALSRLWMIPAGHPDTHAIQALAQEGAGQLFVRLKDQFDFIVFDASPVLPVADALLLSSHVDAVLLAVRSGQSRLPLVQAAQQRLATIQAPVRGAVLMGKDGDLGVSP